MPTVLVVDDSAVDRRLVSGLLKKLGDLRIQFATNGEEALASMHRNAPDLVVSDLVMPHMDGLALVSAVRSTFPGVPVILMTAKGSEETVVEALKHGAASYVPKRSLGEVLAETVRNVLSSASKQRSHTKLMSCIEKVEYTVVLDNDTALVDPLVDYLQDGISQMQLCDRVDCTRVAVALREALLNAMYHGNLEVGSELREKGLREYHALAQERSAQVPYRDRRIVVHTQLSPDEVVVIVRDEGKGFDPSELPDPTDPANIDKLSGRGLLLMKTLMDEVAYNDLGNAVTLVKRRSMPAGLAESAAI